MVVAAVPHSACTSMNKIVRQELSSTRLKESVTSMEAPLELHGDRQ
jgi:hypothetical protein